MPKNFILSPPAMDKPKWKFYDITQRRTSNSEFYVEHLSHCASYCNNNSSHEILTLEFLVKQRKFTCSKSNTDISLSTSCLNSLDTVKVCFSKFSLKPSPCGVYLTGI